MAAFLSMAAPLVTDLRQADELLVLCSSLGMRDKDEGTPSVYHRGDEARGGSSRVLCPLYSQLPNDNFQ